MLTNFLKLKPPTFLVLEIENNYEFIVDSYERMHRLGIIHQHGVEFVSFELQHEAKQWWIVYMECRVSSLSVVSWTHVNALFSEKYVPSFLRDRKREEFMELDQGSIYMVAYEAKFHPLSIYPKQLVTME